MKKFGFATLIASGLTAAVLGFAGPAQADNVTTPMYPQLLGRQPRRRHHHERFRGPGVLSGPHSLAVAHHNGAPRPVSLCLVVSKAAR
jgi:hypothetical protein